MGARLLPIPDMYGRTNYVSEGSVSVIEAAAPRVHGGVPVQSTREVINFSTYLPRISHSRLTQSPALRSCRIAVTS